MTVTQCSLPMTPQTWSPEDMKHILNNKRHKARENMKIAFTAQGEYENCMHSTGKMCKPHAQHRENVQTAYTQHGEDVQTADTHTQSTYTGVTGLPHYTACQNYAFT